MSSLEANRQSAHDALEAARRLLARSDIAAAIRMCKKSSLLPSASLVQCLTQQTVALNPESGAAKSFLKELEALAKGSDVPLRASTSTPPQPQASTSTARPPQPARSDSQASAKNERPFTPKQVAMIKRVRACKIDAYYEILEVEKTCDDLTIKKAFRKVRCHVCSRRR